MHILRDCEYAMDVWDKLVRLEDRAWFFSLGAHSWMKKNLTLVGRHNQHWSQIFGVCIWSLWNARNDRIFNRVLKDPQVLVASILAQVNTIIRDLVQPIPIYIEEGRKEIQVAWQPPPQNVFKVNVDGSFRRDSASVACGGLIRDWKGNLVSAFFCNLGSCNSTWAEMWALLLGIKAARDLQLSPVLFEMDSQVVVNCVHLKYSGNAFLQPLLQEICHLLSLDDWSASVHHVFREANRSADFLANLGHEGPFQCVFLDPVPASLRLILFEDRIGSSLPRLVS